jgi:undecaprenyl-diphosphatase
LDTLKAILLGIIQGLSEFLPISSSGHLVIAEHLLNFQEGGLAFEVFVHFGSLIAVLLVFRKDIMEMIRALPDIFRLKSPQIPEERKNFAFLDIYIIIASIPAALIGVLLEDTIENIFENHRLALSMLFVTGVIMWSARYTHEKRDRMNGLQAVLIGIAQACAIIPGISRSGSTIVTGLWLGIPRDMVAKFSFILSVPVILGATFLKLVDLIEYPLPKSELLNLIIASVTAMLSGYLAILWILDIIKKQKLEWFGVYCIFIATIGLLLV